MGEVLKKFGRYFLLDHIAQGGMAEIYRARLAAPDGAGRLLVIKRIQAGYGANSEFLQMFKSEIKVTMGFNHPNIVQLYDFGEEHAQPYIAMEFVDGRNLRQFMTRFGELKQSFPVELAAYIIEQAAGGLHYAHSFKDKMTGVPLNIVHRDISPQNILIAYEGSVKVIDFGIAKASNNSESTRAGVIKGKPSYLSPEQISGEPLDGRCDIFALGIVLWEMLCGKKLFSGENDLAVLKLIEACQTHVKPPSTINPKVPKELDYIVLRMLAKQREKRYQTAEELQRALHKFLYAFMPDFNPGDLAYFGKDLFKDEIVEDRKKIQRLNEKAEQLLALDIPEAPSGLTPTGRSEEGTRTVVDSQGSVYGQSREVFNQETMNKASKIEVDKSPELLRTAARQRPSQSAAASRSAGSARVQAPAQRIGSSEKQSGGVGKLLLAAAAAIAVVGIFGPELGLFGGGKASRSTAAKSAATPAASVVRDTVAQPVVAGKSILLRLNVTPGGGDTAITVNGKTVDISNPQLVVALDEPLELVADRPGFRPLRREFVLEGSQMNGLKEWLMDVPLEPLKFGYLTLHTTPSADATILIDGKPWVRKTPIENEKFPVGTYNIKLVNEVLGMEKNVTVSIQEGRAVTKDEHLELQREPASQ